MAEPSELRYRDRDVTYGGVTGANLVVRSANPINFYQAINDPGGCRTVEIDAKLFMAESTRGQGSTVMIVPGSLGVGPNHEAHAESLLDAGHNVCVLDPFGARGLASTTANQTPYSFAASGWDVLAALKMLSELDGIDAGRIGAQGHSRGGAAVITAAMRRFADPIVGPDLGLAAVYAVYPWCGQQFVDPTVGSTRVRAILAEADEWCSVQEAQGQVNMIRATGADASVKIVAGAQHGFDRHEDPHTLDEASVTQFAPTAMIAEDGAMIDPITGEPDPGRTDRDVFVGSVTRGWGRRGAAIGGVGDEPAVFTADMLGFFAQL